MVHGAKIAHQKKKFGTAKVYLLYLSKNVALKTHCKFKVIILFAMAKTLLKAKASSHMVQRTKLGQKNKAHPVIV